MKFDQFSVGFLTTKPDAPARSEHEDADIQDAHMAFLSDLHENGQLLAAGPLVDPHFRGLLLVRADVDTAMQLMHDDPAVRAGWFDVTFIPWMVPAGAIHFSSTHFPRSVAELEHD